MMNSIAHRTALRLSSITRPLISTNSRSLSGYSSKVFGGTVYTDLTDRKGSDHYYYSPIPYDKDIVVSKTITSVVDRINYGKKTSIIGVGQVGLAIAYAILNQLTTETMCLVDMNKDKLEGEADDMIQGSAFHERVNIFASTDYSIIENSNIVIITAGVAQKPGESRLSLVGRNVAIMKQIIPTVLEKAPDAAICIATNPCDIMTAVAAKIAGPGVPPGKIFGSGTNLDSSRLRTIIANSVGVDARDVTGYIVGEHGDSSVPVWSSMSIAGVPLLEPGEEPNENHHKIHRAVVESAGDVIRKKGYTNWAIGMACADIAKSVLHDNNEVIPVSTCVRGFNGIEEDVYLSLPCVVGAAGITKVGKVPLTETESKLLKLSAQKIWEVQSGIWDDI